MTCKDCAHRWACPVTQSNFTVSDAELFCPNYASDKNSPIADSGERREFKSGAVRDITSGKGRCDLLPLDAVTGLFPNTSIFYLIHRFMYTKDVTCLDEAIHEFVGMYFSNMATAILETAIHYEDGCVKYGERNWEKGIPLHSYIDSGVRHLLKHMRGDKDERHDRAFIWNMLGAKWTILNRKDLDDIFLPEGVNLSGVTKSESELRKEQK